MLVLGFALWVLGQVLHYLLLAYSIVLFATAVVSWVNADPRNPIVRFLRMATDPLLNIIRRMLPTNLRYFPIDIAFLVLLAMVLFSQYAIAETLIGIGLRMRQPVVMEPV